MKTDNTMEFDSRIDLNDNLDDNVDDVDLDLVDEWNNLKSGLDLKVGWSELFLWLQFRPCNFRYTYWLLQICQKDGDMKGVPQQYVPSRLTELTDTETISS